jgi:hypothetical protein
MSEEEEREILHALETPGRLETPVKKFKLTAVRRALKKLRSKKPQDMTLSQEGLTLILLTWRIW